MEHNPVNVLIMSFPGLGLPRTLSIATARSQTIQELTLNIAHLLPVQTRLLISTNSNQRLTAENVAPVSTLLSCPADTFLPLRISVPVLGGKGGFGSQLRAAGGRMSSKRKKNQGDSNGSSRNLDGRRLRTVNEAKALTQYLAVKPEMDRKEKEARRKRWEQVVDLAEQREEDIKSGTKGRVSGKWAEEKEEATERTRGAVLAAMQSGQYTDTRLTSVDERLSSNIDVSSDDQDGVAEATTITEGAVGANKPRQVPTTFFGFDEDDEFMSEESEDA
jgi:hypothetical protein